MTTKTDIYSEVTNRIIAAIEQGTAPWSKPWRVAGLAGGDRNAITGRGYRGVNTLLLWLAADENQFSSPLWMTFKQAKDAGGSVLKGSKGTRIIFWKQIKVADEKTGEPKTIPMARGYTVFNLDQTKDVKLPKKHVVDTLDDTREVSAIDHIDALVCAHNVDLRHGGDRAFYAPSKDCVQMPERNAFESSDLYYSTLLHELTHWTSHKDRCDRFDQLGKRFGDESYAFEELVAEIGSAMSGTVLGLEMDEYHHTAAYIKSWLKVLKNDNRAIFKAASLAQKASDYLLDPDVEEQRIAA